MVTLESVFKMSHLYSLTYLRTVIKVFLPLLFLSQSSSANHKISETSLYFENLSTWWDINSMQSSTNNNKKNPQTLMMFQVKTELFLFAWSPREDTGTKWMLFVLTNTLLDFCVFIQVQLKTWGVNLLLFLIYLLQNSHVCYILLSIIWVYIYL